MIVAKHMLGPCRMSHSRPGTVSLSIGTNDDDPGIRQRPGYRNTEFVITTGTAHSLCLHSIAQSLPSNACSFLLLTARYVRLSLLVFTELYIHFICVLAKANKINVLPKCCWCNGSAQGQSVDHCPGHTHCQCNIMLCGPVSASQPSDRVGSPYRDVQDRLL